MNRLATALTVVILVARLPRTVFTTHAESASFAFEDEPVPFLWRCLRSGESTNRQPANYQFDVVIADKTGNITMVYHGSGSHELEVGGECSAFVQSRCGIRWVGRMEGNHVLGTVSGSYSISADFWNYPSNPVGGSRGTFNGSWRGEVDSSGHGDGTFQMTWTTTDSWGAFRSNPEIALSLVDRNGGAHGSWNGKLLALGEPSGSLEVIGGTLAVAVVCASISWCLLRGRKRIFSARSLRMNYN